MKSLDTTFETLRDAPKVIETLRKVEIVPLGQELTLGAWTDEGRLGNQIEVWALVKFNGKIYGGVGVNGRVYRYDGTNTWTNCGRPGNNNSVRCLFVFKNNLYAGTDFNAKVYRYNGGTSWIDCGSPAGMNQDVFCLTEYNGEMYAGVKVGAAFSNVYRYEAPNVWHNCGLQGAATTYVFCLKVHNNRLYAGTDSGGQGHVFRYEGGTLWTDLGWLNGSMRVYSLQSFGGFMYAGYQKAIAAGVCRYDGGTTWTTVGSFPLYNTVWCITEYKKRLYCGTVGIGGSDIYCYNGGTSWTGLGMLGASTAVYSFVEDDNIFYAGTGNFGKVWSAESRVTPTDISSYVAHIGQITKRIERELNQFQPSTVPITVNNDNVFIKADKSGLLDYDNLANGYQVKVYVGLTGSTQWVLMFDGKLDPDSVDMPNRETVKFTATGWLDDAKNYNAELVADPDNPPFKNITGVTFITAGLGTQLGSKTLEFGIESSGAKWLSFDGGTKVVTTGDENLWFFDSVKESSIMLTIDYSELPTESQKDKFTIIEHDNLIIACGWWENIRLEFLVDEIMKKIGITDRDIRVEEIENIISQEKNFIYMGDNILPKGNITAFRVVDIDTTNHLVRCLVGITEKSTNLCYVYLLTIAYSAQSFYATRKISLGNGYRAMKFMKFGNKWWVLISSRTPTYILPYTRPFYHAYYLKNFDANWNEDYSFFLPANLGALYDFVYAHSGSVLTAASNEIFFMGQDNTGAPLWDEHVKLFKLTWNGAVLIHTFIKTLETLDTTNNDCFADEWATILPEATDDFYYYGIRKTTSTTYLEIRKYSLVGNAFTTVKDVGIITGYIENFSRNTYVLSYGWQGYFIYQETATVDRGYTIGATGVIELITDEETIKNLRYSNPDFADYYNWWHLDGDGYYYIKSLYAATSGVYIEREKLDDKYSIEEVAPEMFQGTLGSWNYVGVVMEKGSQVITPFLYMPGKVPYIQIADFTGLNCEQALAKLSEAFCCVLDIYEYQKARFYYRGTFNDTDTLDYDTYLLQPQKRYWKNWCDGVIVENSEKDIRHRVGTTDFGSRIIKVDNVFVSSQGMAKVIAEILYAFFGEKKLVNLVKVPFYVESELLDKIPLTLRDMAGNLWRTINTIVYETSFSVSPGSASTHDMELELLEMTGETLHAKTLTEVDNGEIVKV